MGLSTKFLNIIWATDIPTHIGQNSHLGALGKHLVPHNGGDAAREVHMRRQRHDFAEHVGRKTWHRARMAGGSGRLHAGASVVGGEHVGTGARLTTSATRAVVHAMGRCTRWRTRWAWHDERGGTVRVRGAVAQGQDGSASMGVSGAAASTGVGGRAAEQPRAEGSGGVSGQRAGGYKCDDTWALRVGERLRARHASSGRVERNDAWARWAGV